METALAIGLVLLSYLLGSIPPAVWISRAFYGRDIRTMGSGNAGSTNVFNMLGFWPGVATQVIDIVKGALAAALPWLALWIWGPDSHALSGLSMESQCLICGLACVVGHIWPIFAGFRGGKGINTLLGMMLVVNWLAALIALVIFILTLKTIRFVAISSMSAVASYPFFIIAYALIRQEPINWNLVALGVAMALLVIYTHRSNIRNMIAGTEGRNTGFKKLKEEEEEEEGNSD